MSLLGSLLGLLGRFSRRKEERQGEEEMWPLDPPPKLEKQFWEVAKLMASEKRQNAKNPRAIRAKILGGPDVDQLPDASGEFGRDPGNPIPVNGAFGELMYLSLLRSTDTGERLTFHKRGSMEGPHGPVDIYETVTLDGKKWDALLLSPYHPRRSRQAPDGYRLADPKPPLFLFGADRRVARFPDGMTKAMMEMTEAMFGVPLPPPEIIQADGKMRFKRPREQSERLAAALKGADEEEIPAASGDGPPAMPPGPGPEGAPMAGPGPMPGAMPGMMPGPGAMPGAGPELEPEPASRPKKKRKPKPKPQARRKKKKKRRRK